MQRTDNVSLSGPLSLLHTNEETDQLKRLSPFSLSPSLSFFKLCCSSLEQIELE